jgi:hypothetical protein
LPAHLLLALSPCIFSLSFPARKLSQLGGKLKRRGSTALTTFGGDFPEEIAGLSKESVVSPFGKKNENGHRANILPIIDFLCTVHLQRLLKFEV